MKKSLVTNLVGSRVVATFLDDGTLVQQEVEVVAVFVHKGDLRLSISTRRGIKTIDSDRATVPTAVIDGASQ